MAWRTIAAVLTVVFTLVVVSSVMAGPLNAVMSDLQDSGDYGDDNGPSDFDGEQRITDLKNSWHNMTLLAIFGFLTWGVARVVRRERTRGRRGGR